MQAIIRYKRAEYSATRNAFLGYQYQEQRVQIDDGGIELGELLVGILAGDTKSITIEMDWRSVKDKR
jgi:hypothetical protein